MSSLSSSSSVRGLFVGISTLDIIQLVTSPPGSNSKVVSLDLTYSAGGGAANASVTFAHCGGDAELLTNIPEHPLSEIILSDIHFHHVNVVNALNGVPGAPTVSTILVTQATGERSIASMADKRNVSSRRSETLPQLTRAIREYDIVLTDGWELELAIPTLSEAHWEGVPTLLDAGSFKPTTGEVLPFIDIAVVSETFNPYPGGGTGSADSILHYLLSNGVKFAAVTAGNQPIVYKTRTTHGSITVPQVRTIDTLGAGDIFHGALAYFIAQYRVLNDDNFVEALRQASLVAARSVQSFGTRNWMRSNTV